MNRPCKESTRGTARTVRQPEATSGGDPATFDGRANLGTAKGLDVTNKQGKNADLARQATRIPN